MPRLKLSAEERAQREVVGVIDKYARIYDVSPAERAAAMRIGRTSYYSRMKDPDSMTLKELRLLRRRLKMPLEEITSILI